MIADAVLAFVAEAVAEGEVRADGPVVLEEDGSIEQIDACGRGAGGDVVLRWCAGLIVVLR